MLQFLRHLGWAVPSHMEPSLAGAFRWVPLAMPDGQLLVLAQPPESLDSVEAAFRRFEDLLVVHRQLQAALLAEKVHPRLMLLIDTRLRCHLVDGAREEVLLECANSEELEERLLPLLDLSALSRGVQLTSYWKTTRQRAGELEQWTRLWSSRIGAAAGTSVPAMRLFFHWLFLSRLVESLEIAAKAQTSFAELPLPGRAANPIRFLDSVFKPLHDSWNLLQGAMPETQREIARAAQQSGQLQDCLASFGLLSRAKFSAELFAEAFADEDLKHLGWRRALIEEKLELPPVEQLLVAPINADLDTLSFPGLIRLYDRVVDALRELAREQAVAKERGDRPGLQMDFFGSEPPTIQEEDVPSLALQRAIKVHTASRHRAELARLVLLAHATEWHARLRRPEPILPLFEVETQEAAPAPKKPKRPPAPFDPALN